MVTARGACAHRCVDTQEEHAAETSALAAEADMPLDQLLAACGFRIGPDGNRERVLDGSDASKGPADHGRNARSHSAEQVQVKTEQRQSPRTRQQTKPEVKSESAVAVKSEAAALGSQHLDMQAPTSPGGLQQEVSRLSRAGPTAASCSDSRWV